MLLQVKVPTQPMYEVSFFLKAPVHLLARDFARVHESSFMNMHVHCHHSRSTLLSGRISFAARHPVLCELARVARALLSDDRPVADPVFRAAPRQGVIMKYSNAHLSSGHQLLTSK